MPKSALFSLFLVFSTFISFAQNVTYMRDTIYTDKKPYAVLKKSGTVFPNYNLQTLDGKDIFTARYDKIEGVGKRYIITFLGSGNKAAMRYDLVFGKLISQEIVNNKLIENNALNPEGEKRFETAFPMPDQIK